MHFSAGGSYNSILPDLEELEIYFSSTGSHAYTIIDYKCFLHFSKLSENENLVKIVTLLEKNPGLCHHEDSLFVNV